VRILAGTSGFAYREWVGSFYPEEIGADELLPFYARRFGTVEINNSFYRMPTWPLLEKWAGQVPPDFRFTIKANQRITHLKRLKDVAEPLGYFLDVVSRWGSRLGAVLFQLPPNFKKDLARLEDFLSLLPASLPCAFEFRHESWFEDAVYEALRRRGAALCLAESEEITTPVVATAPFGYLRLRRESYDDAALEAWVERMRAQGWREAFVFLKHEDEGQAARLAARLIELAGA
jgi:uncharacterized protein YecE (DUF72 family)